MTEIFLVDPVSLVYLVKEMSAKNQIDQTLVSLVYLVKEMSEANQIEQTLFSLVYLVKEMSEANHIDRTIEIDGFGMECLGPRRGVRLRLPSGLSLRVEDTLSPRPSRLRIWRNYVRRY